MSEIAEEVPDPSPELMLRAKALFKSFDHSTFARLRAGGEHRTVVKLPEGDLLHVAITVSGDRLRLEFDHLPDDQRPASVALFTPRPAENAVIRLPDRAATKCDPVDAETPYAMACDTDPRQVADAETPYALGCDTDPRQAWSTPAVTGPNGFEAWLEQTPGQGVSLFCRMPVGSCGNENLRFRVRWQDPDSILYEFDLDYRRGISKERRQNEHSLGASLRRLRKQRGLRQEDFGPEVASKTIARIEQGNVRTVRKNTLIAIAERLRVAPAELETY